MAAPTRDEAQRRRREARDRRRSTAAKPFEALDSDAEKATGGSDKAKTLKHAAATAVAGAVVAGLAGAAKAVIERRAAGEARRDEPAAEGPSAPEPEHPEQQLEDEAPPSTAVEDDPVAEPEDEEPEDEEPQAQESLQDAPAAEAEPDSETEDEDEGDERQAEADDGEAAGVPIGDAAAIVDTAREQLERMLGSEAERVSGFEHSDGHWAVEFEVVEMHRIPESTDVLSSYEVVLDDDRKLVNVSRKRRYRRSQVDEE